MAADQIKRLLDSSAFSRHQALTLRQLFGADAVTLNGEASGTGVGTITVTLANGAVITKVLTGFVAGGNTAIADTDSILQAFQKAQGQINARLTGNQTITLSGDATGSGATSIAVTLANSGVTAGTYNNNGAEVRPFTVDAKGRITAIGAAVTIAPAFSSITGRPTTRDGYGITDVPRKYSTVIAGGATSEVITHNLNTRDVIVQLVRLASPYDHVEADIESTTVDTVTLRFTAAPAAGEYRVVVHG